MLKVESDLVTKKIKLLYELYQLSQLIKEATRVTMTTSSLIDHILVLFTLVHISDHSLVIAIRKISVTITKNRENIVEIRNIKNFDNQKFIEDLMHQHWENMYFFAEDSNTKWEIWKKIFLEVLHLFNTKNQSKKNPLVYESNKKTY